jgi:2-dehydro-3-deoxygalactonokinase
MRGEETQIVGALDAVGEASCVLCLPGTHSKWVQVEGGRIMRFATFMTGEIFGVLRQHSILGRLMEGDAHDDAAFDAGIERGRHDGGLLHQLFAVRTEGLFAAMPASGLSSFLSGLLIGHEIRAAHEAFGPSRIVLVGTPALMASYAAALVAENLLGVAVAGDVAAAKGLWRLAESAGFFSTKRGGSDLRQEGKPG